MSSKFELQQRIAELEKQVDSDRAQLNRLYQELHTVTMKERIDGYTTDNSQQLLKG